MFFAGVFVFSSGPENKHWLEGLVDSGGYRSSTFVVGSLTSSRATYWVVGVGVWENSPSRILGAKQSSS